MKNCVILYHARCTDGAGAMWSAWKHFQDAATYVAVGKNSKSQSTMLNKCKNADEVYMCDMMLAPLQIREFLEAGIKVILLDHHITNMEALAPMMDSFEEDYPFLIENHCDLERSGAGIAWDYFNKGKPRPAIINYVEDFDLWNWALPNGQSIHTFLSQFNWKNNEEIIDLFNEWENKSPGWFAAKGTPLLAYKNDLMERNLAHIGRAKISVLTPTEFSRMVITYDVPIVNANQFISETGNIMAQGEPFAILWQVMGDGCVRISLRSDKNGEDVGKLAGLIGEQGGGHVHAAGTRFESLAAMLEDIEIYPAP